MNDSISTATSRRLPATLAVVLVASLAIAACGSSTTPKQTAARGSTTASAALSKFRTCLKQHGVTLPDRTPQAGTPGAGAGAQRFRRPGGAGQGAFPGFGGRFGGNGAGASSKFAQAFQACSKYRPAAAGRTPGQFRPRFSAKVLDQFVTCVRKHGYPQMPKASTSGTGALFPSSIEHNPKFEAAAAKCESILRQGIGRQRPPAGSQTGTQTQPASST